MGGSREFDALVAEKVMGWTKPRKGGQIPPCPDVGQWDYFNPPREIEDWRSDYHWREPNGTCWHEPKPYSASIEAAWEVHRKACGWLFSRRQKYLAELTFAIREEVGQPVVWPDLLVLLKPRHICVAALKTVGE